MEVTIERNTGQLREKDGTIRTIEYDSRMIKLDGRLVGYTHINPGGNVSMIVPQSAVSEAAIRRIRSAITEADYPNEIMDNWGQIEFQWVPEDEPDERRKRANIKGRRNRKKPRTAVR